MVVSCFQKIGTTLLCGTIVYQGYHGEISQFVLVVEHVPTTQESGDLTCCYGNCLLCANRLRSYKMQWPLCQPNLIE